MRENERICLSCHKLLKGRMDKKYCNDSCRNSYNNRQNSEQQNLMRNINNILRRNRRVLEDLLSGEAEMARVSRLSLHSKGFDFRYHTHQQEDMQGDFFLFCYEYGYRMLGEDWLLLVRRG